MCVWPLRSQEPGRQTEIEQQGKNIREGQSYGSGSNFWVEFQSMEQCRNAQPEKTRGAEGQQNAQADADADERRAPPNPNDSAHDDATAGAEQQGRPGFAAKRASVPVERWSHGAQRLNRDGHRLDADAFSQPQHQREKKCQQNCFCEGHLISAGQQRANRSTADRGQQPRKTKPESAPG